MNTSNFIIERIKLYNFRGYQETTIEIFPGSNEKRGIVLIGGANGFGKTSIIDAVEWCLTGTIKRLKKEWELRGEKTLALQLGLLRNARTNDPVTVTIEAKYNGTNMAITRSFDGKAEIEGLTPEQTYFKITTSDNELTGAKTIDELQGFRPISSVFYERYICSYEKNIAIYEKSRNDIYQLFSNFFGGTDEIDNIIFSLEGMDKNKNSHVSLLTQASERVRQAEHIRDYTIQEVNDITSQVTNLTNDVNNQDISKALTEYTDRVPLYKGEDTPVRVWSDVGISIDEKVLRLSNNRKVLERIREFSKRFRGFSLAKKYLLHVSTFIKNEELNTELIQPYYKLKPYIE
jgi:DNA repair protein SbcC/Rad50